MRGWTALAAAALLVTLGATSCAPGGERRRTEGGNQVILRLAETHPRDYPTTKGDFKFADLVKERTKGRVVIEVYPDSQLGQEKAVIEQVQFGAIDFTRVSLSVFSSFAPQMNALQMPYLYRNDDHMWKVLNGPIGQELLASLAPAGFIGLGWFEAGSRSFYNSLRPVRAPEDLVGLRIRVQESDFMVAMVNAFGAIAAPMPYGDVYSALQTGSIDGAENNWPSYFSTSHYKVAKYLTLDEHTRVPEIIIASKISLQTLSPADQEVVKQAAVDAATYQRSEWNTYEQVAEARVRSEGNTIIKVDNKAPWREKMRELYAKQPAEVRTFIRRVNEVR